MSIATRTVEIQDPVGIHARPASAFAQEAAGSGCKVTITRESDKASADAASVLMIMSLGIAKGDTITISVDGEDAENKADKLVKTLLENE
ncbi:MAG: HPr family phosphocarrier protein [Bifidobacterium sp.]|uniref:Phosphocarrier protein HPr n=1 Tax=Bifidobacterium fermentum TaxID=3059035 RepID=A0AB39UBE7_9BIFI